MFYLYTIVCVDCRSWEAQMQINAANSVNFQGLNFKKKGGAPKENHSSFMDDIKSAEEKARKNVHLLTVAATSATGLVAITKGKDCITLITKALATTGETISKSAVKATSNVLNAVKKDGKLDTQKAMDRITKCADFLRNENAKPNEKFINGTQEFIGNIFGKEKGKATADFLVKHNMANGVGLAQGVIGGVVGLQIADRAGDRVESALDKKDINSATAKAEKHLEILDTIMAVTEGLSGQCN